MTDESGGVISVICTGIDVTEKRSVEVALRNAEQRQRILLDSIPDAAWMLDAEGRYVAINRTYAKRRGLDQSSAIGKTISEVFPAPFAEKRVAENSEVMRSGKPLHFERRHVIDGRETWYDVTKTPIADDTGEVIGLASLSRDVTERKLAEAQRMARGAS